MSATRKAYRLVRKNNDRRTGSVPIRFIAPFVGYAAPFNDPVSGYAVYVYTGRSGQAHCIFTGTAQECLSFINDALDFVHFY